MDYHKYAELKNQFYPSMTSFFKVDCFVDGSIFAESLIMPDI